MEINGHYNILLQEFSCTAIQVTQIQFSVKHIFRKLRKSDGQKIQLSTCSVANLT